MRRMHLFIIGLWVFLTILSLMPGMTFMLIEDIGWHHQQVEVGHAKAVRNGCQYYIKLMVNNTPIWLVHNLNWSVQNQIRARYNQNRMGMTLAVSQRQAETTVLGVVRTYGSLAFCQP